MVQKLLRIAGAAWASACLSLGMVPPAHANVFYTWTYKSNDGFTDFGTGTLTTGAATAGTGGLGFDITGITGVWNNFNSINPPLFGSLGTFYPFGPGGLPASQILLQFTVTPAFLPLNPYTVDIESHGTADPAKLKVGFPLISWTAVSTTTNNIPVPSYKTTGCFSINGGACPSAGAPGPIAGAGLPFLAIGYGAYWLIKRRRRKSY